MVLSVARLRTFQHNTAILFYSSRVSQRLLERLASNPLGGGALPMRQTPVG